MPEFVVDLSLHLNEPNDWEVSVAVTADNRDDAAAVAMILATYHMWSPGKLTPKKVNWVAVADGVEDGFDEDFRDLNDFVPEVKRKALLESWHKGESH